MTCQTTTGPSMSIPYGNDKSWAIRATNPDGTDKNMTGYTLIFTVAKKTQSTEYLIEKTVSLSTPTQPIKGYLALSKADTAITPGKYVYDSSLWKDGLKQSSSVGTFSVDDVTNTDLIP